MTRTYQQWLGLHNHEGLGHNDVMALLNDWRDEREKLIAAINQYRTGKLVQLDAAMKGSGVAQQMPIVAELPY